MTRSNQLVTLSRRQVCGGLAGCIGLAALANCNNDGSSTAQPDAAVHPPDAATGGNCSSGATDVDARSRQCLQVLRVAVADRPCLDLALAGDEPPLLALVVTSMLFGIYPLGYWSFAFSTDSLVHVATTVVAGLCFGSLRWRTGGLLWSALVHTTVNTVLLASR
jgi:hypothetical protein